jgi:hypothetical protein
MKRFGAVLLLLGGLVVAQAQTPYREAAVAAAALARLQTVAAQVTQGDAKILGWAQEVKARAEKSYEAKAYFRAAREAQAALHLFQAAREPQPAPRKGYAQPFGRPGLGHRWDGWVHARAFGRGMAGGVDPVDRAEKELAYYRAGDPLVKALVDEAKARKDKEPLRAVLLARAALNLISAERGF